VVLVIKPVPGPLRWDLFVKSPFRVAWRKLLGLVTQWRRRRFHALVQRRYGQRIQLTEGIAEVDVESSAINSQAVERMIREANPEVLFVFGSPVLHERLFNLATLGAVNLHLGIAAQYRGENTLFWALRERNPEGLGITFHRIDAGIDTGRVLAYGYPALCEGDGEAELWLSSLELASRMVGRVVAEMKEGFFTEKGTFYSLCKRTPLQDLKVCLSSWSPPRREESMLF